LPDGVASLRLSFVGSKTMGIGLAFNNFSPDTAVPEPSGLILLIFAMSLSQHRNRTAFSHQNVRSARRSNQL
jgi:hypothetical protein